MYKLYIKLYFITGWGILERLNNHKCYKAMRKYTRIGPLYTRNNSVLNKKMVLCFILKGGKPQKYRRQLILLQNIFNLDGQNICKIKYSLMYMK